MSTEIKQRGISLADYRITLSPVTEDTLPFVIGLYGKYSSAVLNSVLTLESVLGGIVDTQRSTTIVVSFDGEPAGFIRLHNPVAGTEGLHALETSSAFDRKFWGDGRIETTCRAVIQELFENSGLWRLEARAYRFNAPANGLCRRLGFRKEGELRGAVLIDGRPRTEVVYSIIRPDYFNRK